MNHKSIILIFCCIGLFAACRNKNPQEAEDKSTLNNSANRQYQSDDSGYEQRSMYTNLAEGLSPMVAVNNNEEVLQIININLDLDFEDEQVLVLKMIDDINTPIKLAIIDYDSIRETFFRSCEYLTNSTNQRAFNLEFEDIIGDYTQEIIFTGTTKDGNTTFYTFKKFPSPSDLGLFYSPICQLVSDGNIRIIKEIRSSSYQLNQKPGKSFPIIVERRDVNSENTLDLIQETYVWNFSHSQYEMISTIQVPGKIVEENQLRALYYSSELSDFETFLDGPWYNSERIENMIVFVPETEQLIFYSADIQEIYKWDYLQKTLYNSLMFIVQNPTSQSPRRRINIMIKSIDTIVINIGDINWDGQYTKVNSSFIETLLNKNNPPVQPSDLNLIGWYEDENEDVKIIFEPPRFTMICANQDEINGGYSITKNIPILNSYYLKRKLRKIPSQLSRDSFENTILGQLSSYSAKTILMSYYNFNRSENNYFLTKDLTDRDETTIWDILLTIQYKGYTKYQLGVLTINILDKNRLISGSQNYILEYAEIHDTTKIIRSLVLTEGELGVTGIEAITDKSLFLSQTEYLD